MSCKKFFDDWVCNCGAYAETVLTILTTLPAGTYVAVFSDKFEAKRIATATADVDGTLEIDLTELPEGYLNQYAGDFELELFEDDTLCERIPIPIRATYDTIALTVKGGNTGKMTIGCQ